MVVSQKNLIEKVSRRAKNQWYLLLNSTFQEVVTSQKPALTKVKNVRHIKRLMKGVLKL